MLPTNTPPVVPDPAGDLAFLEEKLKPKEDNVIKGLSKHIDKVFKQNQKDFKPTRQEMVKALKRVRGEYDNEKKAAIKAFSGSDIYVRSAETKCRAAESWIKDIYQGDVDLPWALEPTEIPELPDETVEMITMQTQQQAMQIEQQLLATGVQLPPEQLQKLIGDYYSEQLDKAKDDLNREAKERCKRVASLIRDNNQEGGWNQAFKDFLYNFVRLKFGVIKGPILTKKKKNVWERTELGYELKVTDQLVNDVYSPSPFNIFPSRGMKSANDGDLIEIHELSKQTLRDLIGVPGYSEVEIRTVLDKYKSGNLKAKWFTVDDETAVKQVTTEKVSGYSTTPPTQNSQDSNSEFIYAMEFYGTVPGHLLVEWGIDVEVDPHTQYQANCWKIGDNVIKAVINPDSLGRKPYHFSSWAKNPEWIVGEGLVEYAAPIEDAMNAVARAMVNNIAIASGPMAEIDIDRVDTDTPIYPWRQIKSTSSMMKSNGPAVNYYQPQMHAGELIQAWQFYSKVLDEMTVPAYAQGASQSGVTAGTATVFTQLLAAASRSIKSVVSNIDDDIIIPYITMCYDLIMKFTEDDQLKGDVTVNAKGVNGLLSREQQAQKKIEYLQVLANPTYQQILGAKNIGAILDQIAKANNIKLPDTDRLDGGETAELQLQQLIAAQTGMFDPAQQNGQMANGGGAPAKGTATRPDGEKAGVNTAQ